MEPAIFFTKKGIQLNTTNRANYFYFWQHSEVDDSFIKR